MSRREKISKYEQFISTYSVQDVYDFYVIQNHRKNECYKHFNTTEKVFRKVLESFNIKKDRNLVTKLIYETKLVQYGDQFYNNVEKTKSTCQSKYGSDSPLSCRHIWDKTHDSMIQRYGGTGFQLMDKDTMRSVASTAGKKMWGTMRQNEDLFQQYLWRQNSTKTANKSFNKSLTEEQCYTYLSDICACDDIIRQYRDNNRYPFDCDFYIKSLDLFIECNFHWTHGGKPYNPNDKECQEQLKIWEEKAKTSKFYKNAIETWVIRDVKKLQIATENKLNYRVFYSYQEVIEQFDYQDQKI